MGTLQRASGLTRRALMCGAMVLGGVHLTGCVVARNNSSQGGEHPTGWTDRNSPNFHAVWLRANGDKVRECSECHGSDYKGGAVGVSCLSSGCHQKSPEFCGTCHGDAKGPRPSTGAHQQVHQSYCVECHVVPTEVTSPGHIGKTPTITFSGIALANNATPSWTPATKTCSGVYCHLSASPTWETPTLPVPCNACHGAPPASHGRWSRVATLTTCQNCHPVPPGSDHINGVVDLIPGIGCDACHGTGPTGAPPPALDGSSDPSDPGVGAHSAHLDATLPNRIGLAVPCQGCHVVPASVDASGHLGTTSPAPVSLENGGAFDPATGSCVVWCHWNRSPGPQWNDTTGAAVACDACHGFPPVTTRDGRTHTQCAPSVSACLGCHLFTPQTHVDGVVEFVP